MKGKSMESHSVPHCSFFSSTKSLRSPPTLICMVHRGDLCYCNLSKRGRGCVLGEGEDSMGVSALKPPVKVLSS